MPLALAWWYTEEEVFAQRAAWLLRTWFLSPATAMNPNLEHADTIPGVGPETGGVVDFARFPRVLDAITLLEAGGADAWTATDRAGMREWTAKLLTWWLTSRPGTGAMARSSNIAQTSSIAAMAMALFTNQPRLAQSVAAKQARRLISI